MDSDEQPGYRLEAQHVQADDRDCVPAEVTENLGKRFMKGNPVGSVFHHAPSTQYSRQIGQDRSNFRVGKVKKYLRERKMRTTKPETAPTGLSRNSSLEFRIPIPRR